MLTASAGMLSMSISIAMCCDLDAYHSVRTGRHSAYQETIGKLLDANLKLFSGEPNYISWSSIADTTIPCGPE
jgi:hypothetical protein